MGWLQRRPGQGVGPYRADAAMVHRGPHPGLPGRFDSATYTTGPQPVRFARAQKGGGMTCRNKTHRARRKHRPRPVRLSRPTRSPSAGAGHNSRQPDLEGDAAEWRDRALQRGSAALIWPPVVRSSRYSTSPCRRPTRPHSGFGTRPRETAASNPGYRALGRLSAFGVLPRPSPQLSGHHPIASEAMPPFVEQSRRTVLCELGGCFGHGSAGAQSARLPRAERAVMASLAEEIAHVKADHNGGYRATAAASDHHAVRAAFQSVSDLIEYLHCAC